jgi:hypothetical protein
VKYVSPTVYNLLWEMCKEGKYHALGYFLKPEYAEEFEQRLKVIEDKKYKRKELGL